MSVLHDHIGVLRDYWAAEFAAVQTTVAVDRVSGTTFNDTTGQETPTTVSVYSGSALIFPMSAGDDDYGETQAETRQYKVRVPYDESGFAPGDRVTVTSTEDGYLDGLVMVVRNVEASVWNASRGLICEVNQA